MKGFRQTKAAGFPLVVMEREVQFAGVSGQGTFSRSLVIFGWYYGINVLQTTSPTRIAQN